MRLRLLTPVPAWELEKCCNIDTGSALGTRSGCVRGTLRPLALIAPQFIVLTAVDTDNGISNAELARMAFVTRNRAIHNGLRC